MSNDGVTWKRLHVAIGVKLCWDTTWILPTRLINVHSRWAGFYHVICESRHKVTTDEEWNGNLKEVAPEGGAGLEGRHLFNTRARLERTDCGRRR